MSDLSHLTLEDLEQELKDRRSARRRKRLMEQGRTVTTIRLKGPILQEAHARAQAARMSLNSWLVQAVSLALEVDVKEAVESLLVTHGGEKLIRTVGEVVQQAGGGAYEVGAKIIALSAEDW